MSSPLTGGCLCGAVTYSIDADPAFSGHCGCQNCRKATGVEHASIFAVPTGAVEVSGALSTYRYSGDSGAPISKHFCPACGSHVVTDNPIMGGMRMFPVGSLDDINQVEPQMFVYHADCATWEKAGDAMTTFEKMPPMS